MKHLLYILALFFITFAITLADDNNESSSNDFSIVSREEWKATRPRHPATPLTTLPPSHAIIAHTATGGCLKKENCIRHMQNFQVMNMQQQGLDDIVYNFLVGGDGNVYEGRGWDVDGAHTKRWNEKSLSVAFLGDFSYKAPSQLQLDAAKKFLEYATAQNKLAKNYKLVGQRQIVITKSPGDKLYEIIKGWEHWTDRP